MSISFFLKRFSFFILIFSCLFSCKEKPKTLYDVVISNVNLIDLETGDVNNLDIYIKEGRIELLKTHSANSAVKSEQTIDAQGKYALPGFWDNHVHFRGGDSLIDANKNFLKLFLANGITTVRDAGGDLTSAVMEWKKAIADGTLAGPTIFTSGPKIDGPNATWAGSLEVENDADINAALDSLQRIPVDFVKLYDSRISGENYLKTIKEAEKRGLTTSGHMPFSVTLDETIAAGIDGVEHLYYIMKGCAANEEEVTAQLQNNEIGFWGAMPLLLDGYSDSVANITFTKLKEHNVYSIPTLHIGETLSFLDEVDHSTDPYLKYMGPGIQKTYQGRINSALNSSDEAKNNRKELQRFFAELAKKMNDAGVSLLAGSDSGAFNSYTYPGISLHKEMEAMVAAGMSPLQALRNSAYNGAHFLKKETDYGTLEEGKIADVVLLNTNPLTSISNTQDIYAVIKSGKFFSASELEKLVESIISKN